MDRGTLTLLIFGAGGGEGDSVEVVGVSQFVVADHIEVLECLPRDRAMG